MVHTLYMLESNYFPKWSIPPTCPSANRFHVPEWNLLFNTLIVIHTMNGVKSYDNSSSTTDILIFSPCIFFQFLPVNNAFLSRIFFLFMLSEACGTAWGGQFYPHTVSNHPLRCYDWGFLSLLRWFQVWINNETEKLCETTNEQWDFTFSQVKLLSTH